MIEAPSKEQIEELARKCLRSPADFCRILLPDWFPTKMPWVHRGLLALLQNKTDFLLDFGPEQWRDELSAWTPQDLRKLLTNFIEEGTDRPIFSLVMEPAPHITISTRKNVCIVMPRGSSKTTIVNASNLMDIEFENEDFFLYVSESGNHAERQLGTIKNELEDNDGIPNNELLNLVFGNHKPSRQSPLKWTENYIETLKGVMVGAVGRGGQIRGFGKRAKRPGKIVYDDLEDEESVLSDTQRKKDFSWFWNAARPAKRKHTGKDVVLGTLLHTDAILNKCIASREFTAVRFGAIDRQGDALWEWWMNLEQIEEARQAAAEIGELPGFYLEYMSEYKDDVARIFPESKLIYVHKGIERFPVMAMALDPAISEDRKADMAALAVMGMEAGGHKHVLESFGKVGMDSDAMLDKFFELHFKWMKHLPLENRKYGIEAIAFQRALIPMARARMVQLSRPHTTPEGTLHAGWGNAAYFEIVPIFHGKIAKPVRVKGILKPLIWAGQLSFESRNPDMHTQLTDWPNGKKDLPDVAAMCAALLDPYVMLGLGEDAEEQLEGDHAPPLSAVVGGDFRSAP